MREDRNTFLGDMGKLRIAIQKSGRLYDDSISLLKECGIDLRNVKDRLKTESDNFPLEVFFLRDDDIPQYIEDGVADIGIVGENVLAESESRVEIVEKLGFGNCRLSLAVPKSFDFNDIGDFANKRIATTYPKVLNKFLSENRLNAEIHN